MKRIFRFIKALVRYIIYGKRVEFDDYVARLIICCHCNDCDNKLWKCNDCGCYLDKKAKMSTEKCPKNKW